LLQLSQPAGDLGNVNGLEQVESEADATIAPTTHGEEAAQEEGQTVPGRCDQVVFEAQVRFPAGSSLGIVAMAEKALSFPGGVLVVFAQKWLSMPRRSRWSMRLRIRPTEGSSSPARRTCR